MERKKRKFKPAPKEDPNFKLGYKVNHKTHGEGMVTAVPRGDGPGSEKILVDFSDKPKQVLKKDCQIIEREELTFE